MITSFGSDGSDSEDENNSSDERKTSTHLPEPGNSNHVPYLKSGEIGPALCPTGMQSPIKNSSRSYKLDSTNSTNISNSTSQCNEQSDENRIAGSDNKNSVIQGEKDFSPENKTRKDINVHNTVPKLDLKVSLVPGYGDDSDGEEEVRSKQEIKPLFPISQDENYTNVTNLLKDVHGAFTKNSGTNVQDPEQCNDNSEDTRETKDEPEKAEEKESKTDEDKSKTNIFLEDMQVCGKAFQRKKRIAFDGNYIDFYPNNLQKFAPCYSMCKKLFSPSLFIKLFKNFELRFSWNF